MNQSLRRTILEILGARERRRPNRPRPPQRPRPDRPNPKPPTDQPTLPAGGTDTTDDGDARCLATCAEDQLGKKYVHATAGPNTFDCSGLVYWCVKQCTGKEISRSSYDQARLGKPVSGATRPGDILIYGNGSHVGIVTGANRQVTALNENAGVVSAQIPGNMGLVYNGARRLFEGADVTKPDPAPVATKYVGHKLPGSSVPLYLPDWLRFSTHLTPIGGNRSGQHQTPTVTVFHTTNNPTVGRGAANHAQWQENGTQGNPGIGVHAYVDAKEVVWTIPINEKGVHSGDWRNDWGIAVERTTNADQEQWAAENNAMHVHAGLLYILQKTAKDAMYPHTDGGHCPRLVKPWGEVERIVDMRVQRIKEFVDAA